MKFAEIAVLLREIVDRCPRFRWEHYFVDSTEGDVSTVQGIPHSH